MILQFGYGTSSWYAFRFCSPSIFRLLVLLHKGLTQRVLKGHTKWVFCLNYNTTANLLVSGGCEGDVRIWNVARGNAAVPYPLPPILPSHDFPGKCMKTLHAHLDYVTAVHFNRDATLIVSCALDGLMYAPCVRLLIAFSLISSPQVESGTRLTDNASKHLQKDMMLSGMPHHHCTSFSEDIR